MADIIINPSSLNRPRDYEGRDYEVELSELPKTRAPSYTSRNSAWPGDDNDEDFLIKRDRALSSADPTKGSHVTVRAESLRSHRAKKSSYKGWRFGVLVSAWTAFTVLMLNLILTTWAAAHFQTSLEDGVGTAFEGSCDVVNTWTTWLHILINVLSSVLLSASNYTMQCICSPTRQEIDDAHANGDWMDVGVASVRNIYKINWTRRCLWWALALSSIPIHLLYNSAIFRTLDAHDYEVATVNPDFFTTPGNFSEIIYYPSTGLYYQPGLVSSDMMNNPSKVKFMQGLFGNGSAYLNPALVQNMSNNECISAYAAGYVTGRSHVLAVTNTRGNTTNETVFFEAFIAPDAYTSNGWICKDASGIPGESYSPNCDAGSQRKNATNWTINSRPIDYCLSYLAPAHCKLQFSVYILAAVILMNACKAAVMFFTLYRQKDTTLVTVGDALASWLERPDVLTKGRCLMGKVDVGKGPLRWRVQSSGITSAPSWRSHSRRGNALPNTTPLPVTYYAPMRQRWFAAASLKRWLVTTGLIAAALITAISLFGAGYSDLAANISGASPFSLGFGAVDSRATIEAGLPQGGASGLVSAVLLANLPQAICSFLYLAYNGLLTCMHLCHEFSKYAVVGRRKPLRVTTPHGDQRSTYYLQLPYTYSLPLIVASATLHWLISQCIFLVRVDIYSDFAQSDDGTGSAAVSEGMSEVGFSLLPILLVVALGTCMLGAAVALGFRKFASHIPMAGSCSVALAAAAHRPKRDVDAAYLPVQWGEVNSEGTEVVGHCCFTSEEVHDLIPGRLYAGSWEASSGLDDREGHNPGAASYAAAVAEFTALGLDVYQTELDVEFPPTSADSAQQATDYYDTVSACMQAKRCTGMTVWDFDDTHSWIPSTFAGQRDADLFWTNFTIKPAYAAVYQAIEGVNCTFC